VPCYQRVSDDTHVDVRANDTPQSSTTWTIFTPEAQTVGVEPVDARRSRISMQLLEGIAADVHAAKHWWEPVRSTRTNRYLAAL
jgi:hypothetical protein